MVRGNAAVDRDLAFRFMQLNYRYGLLDEVGSILGDALDAVMTERGMDMEDVLDRLDGAGEGTVERIDRFLAGWGNLLLRPAANETMTRLAAFLVRRPVVRGVAVRLATSFLGKRLAPSGCVEPTVPGREGCT